GVGKSYGTGGAGRTDGEIEADAARAVPRGAAAGRGVSGAVTGAGAHSRGRGDRQSRSRQQKPDSGPLVPYGGATRRDPCGRHSRSSTAAAFRPGDRSERFSLIWHSVHGKRTPRVFVPIEAQTPDLAAFPEFPIVHAITTIRRSKGMQHDFYLAWRYLCHNKIRSLILAACLAVIMALPPALHCLWDEAERWMSARAEATPLVVGAKGSAADLVLSTLYFTEAPAFISMGEAD